MGMNSFSHRSKAQKNHEVEEELSGLLNLHPEGESIQSKPLKSLNQVDYEPLDFGSLKKKWSDPNGQRIAPRYEINLTVLIVSPHQSFRTQCQNVSASGLLVKDLLPESFHKGKFEIVLIRVDERGRKTFILFRGRAVKPVPRTRRIQFEAMSADSEAKLQRLFKGLQPTG